MTLKPHTPILPHDKKRKKNSSQVKVSPEIAATSLPSPQKHKTANKEGKSLILIYSRKSNMREKKNSVFSSSYIIYIFIMSNYDRCAVGGYVVLSFSYSVLHRNLNGKNERMKSNDELLFVIVFRITWFITEWIVSPDESLNLYTKFVCM